jgi:uncharacterized protein
MKIIKILICFYPVFLSGNFIFSQDKKDIELVGQLFETKQQIPEYKNLTKNNSNEIQWITSGLLIFYKTFFSSQDGNRCVFQPSCSVYAIESVKKKGFIIGFAAAMDRLIRCNRLSAENYEKFENTNLLYDPVK